MEVEGCRIGFAITGSFCTFTKTIQEIENLCRSGAKIYPIFSKHVAEFDNRFWKASDFIKKVQEITGEKGIFTIQEAEPIGPKAYLDLVIIAPCTGNTIAKLANGIIDGPVLMAAKAQLRNEKPVVIAISTNDALGLNGKNIGGLLNMKNLYFVPFGQDDYHKKPTSLVAHMELISETASFALDGRQIQPLLREFHSKE